MQYPGGKNSNGSFQNIISEIAPCELYVEGFAGSGAVWRAMLPAKQAVLIDRDAHVLNALNEIAATRAEKNSTALVCGDCVTWLIENLQWLGDLGQRATVYLDPPYLYTVRRGGERSIYAYEMGETWEHERLLSVAKQLACHVLISGYWSELYDQALDGWRVKSWQVQTRAGGATEYLWMNYPVPVLLHDGRYVGQDFTQRQRLRRLMGVEKR